MDASRKNVLGMWLSTKVSCHFRPSPTVRHQHQSTGYGQITRNVSITTSHNYSLTPSVYSGKVLLEDRGLAHYGNQGHIPLFFQLSHKTPNYQPWLAGLKGQNRNNGLFFRRTRDQVGLRDVPISWCQTGKNHSRHFKFPE